MRVCVHVCVHMCVCACVCECVHVCVYVYVDVINYILDHNSVSKLLQAPTEGPLKGSNPQSNGSHGTSPNRGNASLSSTPSHSREGTSIERDPSAISSMSSSSSFTAARRSRGFPMLGKTLLRLRSGKRSSSAPNLGEATPSYLHAATLEWKPRLLICMPAAVDCLQVSCSALSLSLSLSLHSVLSSELCEVDWLLRHC